MAEVAGLVLGATGFTALFGTCIKCFDVVVEARGFSEDYEQLCTLFSLQRARFGLWGESVGLIPNPVHGKRLRYDDNLDRPDIRPGLERILNNIKVLLDEASEVNNQYGLNGAATASNQLTNSRGLEIFRDSFERFKIRVKKHQKDTSIWKVTKWAIHDSVKFGSLIERLEKLVDGLESITKSLGLLQEQHARLREEIESISDMESLRLLRDASSHTSSQLDVSDAASRRLTYVAQSIRTGTINSFKTAPTRQSSVVGSWRSEERPVPGSWPKSTTSGANSREPRDRVDASDRRPPQSRNAALWSRLAKQSQQSDDSELKSDLWEVSAADEEGTDVIPQNRRIASELLKQGGAATSLSFANGDLHYGEQLAGIKKDDEAYWLERSAKILSQANDGSSAAKRMFIELRNIRGGKVPFVSAVPLNDSLNEILASIEGPPDTPYEGGVFWITVKLSDSDSFGPPLMRFQTKIYHPNISSQGNICADYGEKWNEFLSAGERKKPYNSNMSWNAGRSTDIRWSLGAILTALCGLLASPNVDDPLVPEIAQTLYSALRYLRFLEEAVKSGLVDSSTSNIVGEVPSDEDENSDSKSVVSLSVTIREGLGLAMEIEADSKSLVFESRSERRPGSTTASHSPSSERGTSASESKPKSYGIIGVCAMDVKARSKPMTNILNRVLSKQEFEVCIFGDKMILDEEIENWPVCDFLISFYSDGFPLDKAIAYVKARKPFCVNDPLMQKILLDRRSVQLILEKINVPTPQRVEVSRDGGQKMINSDHFPLLKKTTGIKLKPPPLTSAPHRVELVDDGDTLSVDGILLTKPFVEKSTSGEDLDICVYFPKSQRGGGRMILRNHGRKGSVWIEDMNVPRAISEPDSSYIYEKFIKAENTEKVQAYTVGPYFCYAETRQSTSHYTRNTNGKEIRSVISLTTEEKTMASTIAHSFAQRFCGFHLLRTPEGKSFVTEIDTCTFMNGNDEYYNQCARVLKEMFIKEVRKKLKISLGLGSGGIPPRPRLDQLMDQFQKIQLNN
ncbi:hypothetical protein VTL71DRAFT_4483 [Oculimacula yallundae]|uniref:Inositol hexakisphosphate and diphosphoinositol-pentakisphosphate kinase n=1 Tax=Oculimacula yallundae TaxID=86028 RepID=A0ABR4C255_9HELO